MALPFIAVILFKIKIALYIDKIHTIKMVFDKIKRNPKINAADIVEYCINKVLDKNCNIYTFCNKTP